MDSKWIHNNRLVLSFIKLTIHMDCGINDIPQDICNENLSVYVLFYPTIRLSFTPMCHKFNR